MPKPETPPKPHSQIQQIKLEDKAMGIRKRATDTGQRLPPACAYLWTPKNTKDTKYQARTCARNAGAGTQHSGKNWCDFHEWWHHTQMIDPSVRKQVAAAQSIAMQNTRLFGNLPNIGPQEALIQEVQRTAGVIQWIEDLMGKKAAGGENPEDFLIQYTKLGITPHAWMTLYQDERKHLVRVSAEAIKCGVAEREVRVREDMGRIIAATMMALIHDRELGLSPKQLQTAPLVVRRLLTASPRMDFNPDAVIEAALTPEEVEP